MRKIAILSIVMGIIISCSKDDDESETMEYIPGEVTVGIKSGTEINELFDFINLFDHQVDNINSLTFTSDLPSDSLQYILDNLNDKVYTNDGANWWVSGHVHGQTNEITILPRLFDMENIDYQNDWLESMEQLKLNQKHNSESNSGVIRFNVPDGQEIEWRNQFANYDIVDWAELNYLLILDPYPN